MKRKVNLNLVTGDANLVGPDEIYVQYDKDGKIIALKQRNSAGELAVIVDTHVDQYVLEDNKTKSQSLAALKEGDTIVVTPTTGKDGMKKVTVTITA